MSKKAVYNNKGLAIYITGEDFKNLLERRALDVPLYIGKTEVKGACVVVKTLTTANQYFKEARQLEHEAIENVRAEHAKSKVRHLTTEEVSRRLKNG